MSKKQEDETCSLVGRYRSAQPEDGSCRLPLHHAHSTPSSRAASLSQHVVKLLAATLEMRKLILNLSWVS